MNEYKRIKRSYIIANVFKGESYFIAGGIWANGQLAYSRIDEKGNEVEECEYYQTRMDGKLVMVHC